LIEKLENLQYFVNSKTEINSKNIIDYTTKFIETLINLIDQKYAWIDYSDIQRMKIASKILKFIQYSSFTLLNKQNLSENFFKIKERNIYLITFYLNSSEEINFANNSNNTIGSIHIPEGISTYDENEEIGNIA
jgi:hypothetical protein